MSKPAGMKVGVLARQTGLSIRTLHYYDEIGLLTPSQHTESGHRLYTRADVARLQQIMSLRQIGFRLEEIRDCLDGARFSPCEVIELHVTRLREQIEMQRALCRRLEALARHCASNEVSVEEFVQTIEGMTRMDKYYKPEHQAEIRARGEQLGEQGLRQAEADWAQLIAEVRAEMDKGTPPSDPRAQALAQRWRALVEAFTGGNPEIEQGLNKMWHEETTIHGIETAPMREMGAYIGQALAASQKPEA